MRGELFKRIVSSLILIPIVFFCIIKGSYLFNILILIAFLLTCYEWISMTENNKLKIIGILFLIISYFTTYLIRNNFETESLFLFLTVILICISTDLGGYIFGKIIKGPKLTKISPNKTISGVAGGIILSITVVIIFVSNSQMTLLNNFEITSKFIAIVILISIVSQIGDIIISYFKRLSKLKDTGNIIPGHGGILDRTDGMIFAFPFSYILFLVNLL